MEIRGFPLERTSLTEISMGFPWVSHGWGKGDSRLELTKKGIRQAVGSNDGSWESDC